MLREEVGSFIEAAVDEALAAEPSTTVHRDFLVNAFVQALEQNASWVELYGITGELNVPGLLADSETSEVLSIAAGVGGHQQLVCPYADFRPGFETWTTTRRQ